MRPPKTPASDMTAPRAVSLPPRGLPRAPIDSDALRARLRIASDDFFVLYTALHPPRRLHGD